MSSSAAVRVARAYLALSRLLGFSMLVLHPSDCRLVVQSFFVESIARQQLVHGPVEQPSATDEIAGVAEGGAKRDVAFYTATLFC
ncbi:MAG TPA: hypothetical protein VGX91_10045 [Candidatus Cybelea sp.]|nr:hypothetical protein [Candidatus Cybelea sp.]